MKNNEKLTQHSLELCRLCGVYDYLEIDILEESSLTGPDFRAIVFQCSGVWIRRNDRLTTKLCLRCFEEIKYIANFRSGCASTDNKLKMEFGLQSDDDVSSGDELDGDDSGVYDRVTPIGDDLATRDKQAVGRSLEPEVDGLTTAPQPAYGIGSIPFFEGQTEIKIEDTSCDAESYNSPSNLSEMARFPCVSWSNDSESAHSNVEMAPVNGVETPEKNGTRKPKKEKTERKTSVNVDFGRYTVKCGFSGRCWHRFDNVEAMEFHVETYHTNKLEREFHCHLCRRRKSDRTYLQKHMNAVHTGFKPFICTLADCRKAFARKDCLKRHTKAMHTQSKMFDCPVCYKKIYRRFHFNRHMVYRHGNGTHHCCYLCKKTFCNKQRQRMHFNVKHVGRSPYRCNVPDCQTLYYSKGHLDLHTNAKHTQKITYNCNKCTFKSYYKGNFKHHLAHMHREKTAQS